MKREPSNPKGRPWINAVVFVALIVATGLRLWSPWGLLFLYWIIPGLVTGHAFLVTDVSRDETPLLFWLIQLTWLLLGIMMILMDFLPELA